jgi:hypothetical protein
MRSAAGMATDRGTSTCALEQVSSLRYFVRWLVGGCILDSSGEGYGLGRKCDG